MHILLEERKIREAIFHFACFDNCALQRECERRFLSKIDVIDAFSWLEQQTENTLLDDILLTDLLELQQGTSLDGRIVLGL
jgi:hypothetical protein